MNWELVASAALGLLAVWLVLSPVGRPRTTRAVPLADPFDVEETARGRAVEALREIDFDRATGKLSDEDYALLKARYTAMAVQAMRAEQATQPADADLEAMIAARRHGTAGGDCPTCGPRPEHDAVFCSTCGGRLPTGRSCAGCHAPIPADGQFCDQCGARVAA